MTATDLCVPLDGHVFLDVAKVNGEYRFVAVKKMPGGSRREPRPCAGIISYDMIDRPDETAVDFIPGGTLASFIDDNKGEPRVRGYDMMQKWKIAYDLADQVFRLHERKDIHGRLNSENVLVDENLLGVIVINHEQHMDRLRPVEAYTTQWWYDPPELQNRNAELFLERVKDALASGMSNDEVFNTLICKIDVYMFGLMLYELFVETYPFSDKQQEPRRMMKDIEEGRLRVTFDDPIRLPKSVNCPVKDLINWCTSFDAKERPTMAEVKEELRNLALDECDELDTFMDEVDTNPRTPTVHGTLEKLVQCADKGIPWSRGILQDAISLWNRRERAPVLKELATV